MSDCVEADPTGGYMHPAYTRSLSEWGTPRPLVAAGGWTLERAIPGSERTDAMGPYPLLCCRDWTALADDLDANPFGWVTFTAVADPLGAPPPDTLRTIFRDHVVAFKTHYIVELDGWNGALAPTHRRRFRAAARLLETDAGPAVPDALDDWISLYADLIRRHQITGISAFSTRSFAQQLATPGIHVCRAFEGGRTAAMSLWIHQGEHAYYHLGAASDRGYEVGASYAMFDTAIRYLGTLGVRLLDLGGAPGTAEDPADGLARFKRGWSNAERMAQLCGRILDGGAYAQVAAGEPIGYFPSYRASIS